MPRPHLVFGQNLSSDTTSKVEELRHNMTLAERCLWAQLKASRLGGFHFRRQQPIGPYIVDFYCHESGLVVEVDGEIHQYQQEADAERERNLIALGLRVLRFSNQQVLNDPDSVKRQILDACRIVSE